MNSDSFIYLPGWVKVSAIFLLTFTLLGAFGVAIEGVMENRDDGWITVSMSVVQVCVSGLGLALVIFFSQRAISIDNLVLKGDEFLERDVPAAVARLESLRSGTVGALAQVALETSHARGSAGAWYDGSIDDVAIGFRVNLRVGNMIAVIYAPAEQFEELAAADELFASTLERARDLGFTARSALEPQERDGKTYVLFYLIKDLEPGFLFNTEARLGLLQQLTLIIRSASLTARRRGAKLGFGVGPAPR